MRVNAVNTISTSFGRVVKIKTEPASSNMEGFKTDARKKSIIDAIEGKKSSPLNKNNAFDVICNFLRAKIGDYNPKEGLVAEEIGGDVYIFTGKDAAVARKVVQKASENKTSNSDSWPKMEKEFELSELIGKARYTGTYGEIDADFDDKENLSMISYSSDVYNIYDK